MVEGIYIKVSRFNMGTISAVAIHPKVEEIREHLVCGTMSMKDIERIYGDEEHPLSYDSIVWYKNTYIKPVLEEVEENQKEEIAEEIRRLRFKLIDVLEDRIQTYMDKYRHLPITNREVIEFMKLYAQITGAGFYSTIHMHVSWGNKISRSPRHDKSKIFNMTDLENMR